MTNFAMKLIEFLDEDVIDLLWREVVKEAKENEEREDDIRDYARNYFIDKLSDYLYDEIQKLEDDIRRELIEAALDDADIESIVDYIIVNKNYNIGGAV